LNFVSRKSFIENHYIIDNALKIIIKAFCLEGPWLLHYERFFNERWVEIFVANVLNRGSLNALLCVLGALLSRAATAFKLIPSAGFGRAQPGRSGCLLVIWGRVRRQ